MLEPESAPNLRWCRHPGLFILLSLASVGLENLTALDRAAQGPFFNGGAWLITPAWHAANKDLLYTGPKALLILLGLLSLAVFLAAVLHPKMRTRLAAWKKPALLLRSPGWRSG